MDSLPEELLDRIVSDVTGPLPLNEDHEYGIRYRHLLSLSRASRKLCRITEPYIYRDLICSAHEDDGNEDELLHTLERRSDLHRHIKAISLKDYQEIEPHFEKLVWRLPNLRRLDISIPLLNPRRMGNPMSFSNLRDWIPVLRMPSITTLRLKGVVATEITDYRYDDWDFINNNITSLDISFTWNAVEWEECNETWAFAATFRHLKSLRISGSYDAEAEFALDAPVFRRLVHAFKHTFDTTLRDFDFRYNNVYYDNEMTGDAFDARTILKQSRLEHLKLDTESLCRREATLRSLEVGPSSLPSTLETLYLRHAVDVEGLNQAARNLMHSDEAQCLSQLVELAARTSRFPNLQRLTLVIFLPTEFEEVASRVVKVHARKAKVQLDVMLV
jgi:hypothetical protein